jgi:uncharacterized protein
MLLNLAELSLRGGQRYERVYPLEIEPVTLGGSPYRVLVPGGVSVVVDRVAGGYLVTVSLDARVYGPCSRCLGEAVFDLRAEQQDFAPATSDRWEESDLSEFIKDLVVDVGAIAREAVVLALPAQPVCEETCKGLCPLCGADLNKGDCRCEMQLDDRWNALRGSDQSP